MKLRVHQLLGYAAGDSANNLAFSMASMFLLIYYTDVAGIPVGIAGTIFLVVRVWDGAADLVAGRLVDKTSSRWGKFRPWILFGSVPLLVLSVASFAVPDWGLTAKVIYALVTYAAVGTAYSLVNIPYGSLVAAETQDSVERSKLASARSMGAAATIMLLALVVAPQIKGAQNLQQSLLITTSVFVVIGFGMYLFTFLTARESVPRSSEKVSLRQSLRTLRKNKPLMMLCASSLVFLVAMFSIQTIGIYYARDVLGDANLYIFITLAQVGMMFVLAPIVPKLVRRVGKRSTYVAGGAVMAVGCVGVMFAPASVPAIAIGCFVLVGCGLGVVNTVMWSLEADTVEYGEWQTGTRAEGAAYSVFSFVRKVGQALGGAAAAYTIGIAGYVGSADVQSASALWGIRAAAGLVPAVLTLIALGIIAAYPLTEKRFREITDDISQRGTANESNTDTASDSETDTARASVSGA